MTRRTPAILFGGLLSAAALAAQSVVPLPTKPPSPAAKASAKSESAPAAAAAPAATAEMTAADVEAFLDGVMPAQLGPGDVGGAVVVVVKDGKVLFGKGYGFADVEKR